MSLPIVASGQSFPPRLYPSYLLEVETSVGTYSNADRRAQHPEAVQWLASTLSRLETVLVISRNWELIQHIKLYVRRELSRWLRSFVETAKHEVLWYVALLL